VSSPSFQSYTLWEGLARDEYERLYIEALNVLRGKVSNLGQPETPPDGIRIVSVNGMLCDDELVFRLVWGKTTAQVLVDGEWTPLRGLIGCC
jgi:hypothetical protein